MHSSAQQIAIGLLLMGVAVTGGCASLRKPKAEVAAVQPPSPAQLSWWDANHDKAKYVPGKGYYVEGTSGFFDDRGRPIQSASQSSVVTSSDYREPIADANAVPTDFQARFKKFAGKAPNEPLAKSTFTDGEALFRQANYKGAAKKFKVAYERGPDMPQEEDAMFKCAESFFFCDQYSKANDTYGLLIKKYPSTQYLDRVVARRFAIGRYWEMHHQQHPQYALTPNLTDKTRPMFDTKGHALKIYDRVRLDDPTGPLADDSLMATANRHFLDGNYPDADYYYDILRKDYPKSEHQFDAHMLGLQAKLRKYQGPDYEGATLDEADELAKQLLTQFPTELGDERQQVADVRAQIKAQRATRDFTVAEFYHKNKYFGASRIYYENVASTYPDTKLAEASRSRLEETKDQPASPTPPFEWIAKILPEQKTGSLGMASSAVPSTMGSAPPGMGTLGGIGGGMPATVNR